MLAAAAELNYQYKPRAAKFVNREKSIPIRNLLYVVNDYGDIPILSNPFYGAILNRAVAVSASYNSYVHPAILQHEHPLDAPLPEELCNADGILLASPYPPELVKKIASAVSCPMVLIDNFIPGSPYDTIMNDDFGGAYQAVQYLLELGHRTIYMIIGPLKRLGAQPSDPPSIIDRHRGYSAAMLDGGYTPFSGDGNPARLQTNLPRAQRTSPMAGRIAGTIALPDGFVLQRRFLRCPYHFGLIHHGISGSGGYFSRRIR